MRLVLFALLIAAAAEAQAEPAPRRPVETVPANGVDESPRRGTFVESTLGVFTTFGGSAKVSNGQPYLGITVGREVGERGALFGSLGIGASSASCFTGTKTNGDCVAADSFGATFVEAGASYGVGVALRTLLSLKVLGGLSDLSPGPVTSNNSVPDHLLGFHVGGGLALDYDTHLDHFAVGLDAIVRYTMAKADSSLALTSLAVMPRIRYVF
jgi:hypothetical protein